MIIIESKKDGFRRCGIAHSTAPVTYPDGKFTEKELAQLQAEPMLTVIVAEGAEEGEKSPTKAKTKAKDKDKE